MKAKNASLDATRLSGSPSMSLHDSSDDLEVEKYYLQKLTVQRQKTEKLLQQYATLLSQKKQLGERLLDRQRQYQFLQLKHQNCTHYQDQLIAEQNKTKKLQAEVCALKKQIACQAQQIKKKTKQLECITECKDQEMRQLRQHLNQRLKDLEAAYQRQKKGWEIRQSYMNNQLQSCQKDCWQVSRLLRAQRDNSENKTAKWTEECERRLSTHEFTIEVLTRSNQDLQFRENKLMEQLQELKRQSHGMEKLKNEINLLKDRLKGKENTLEQVRIQFVELERQMQTLRETTKTLEKQNNILKFEDQRTCKKDSQSNQTIYKLRRTSQTNRTGKTDRSNYVCHNNEVYKLRQQVKELQQFIKQFQIALKQQEQQLKESKQTIQALFMENQQLRNLKHKGSKEEDVGWQPTIYREYHMKQAYNQRRDRQHQEKYLQRNQKMVQKFQQNSARCYRQRNSIVRKADWMCKIEKK